jgi:hypothetical protein
MMIKVYKTITLSIVSYDCEIWSPIVGEEHTQMVIGNGVLRKIRPNGGEVTGLDCRTRSVIIYTPHQISFE